MDITQDVARLKKILLDQGIDPPYRFVTSDPSVIIHDPEVSVLVNFDCPPGGGYLDNGEPVDMNASSFTWWKKDEELNMKLATEDATSKKAASTEAAWNMQEKWQGKPHGWIQWKGTNVCLDVHCECGHLSHIDADFAYHVECPKCHRVYFCNGHIELIELEQRPETCVVMGEDDDENEGKFM